MLIILDIRFNDDEYDDLYYTWRLLGQKIDFSAFRNLKYLSCSNLKVDNDMLSGLQGVIKLKLLNCRLESKSLSHLINLQILQVDCVNRSVNLSGLDNLKLVVLSDLENFDHLKNLGNSLTGLQLNQCSGKIEKANKFFKKHQEFSNVTHLQINESTIGFNKEWLDKFTCLRKLSLVENDLKSVDFLQHSGLSNLEELDLSYNSIKSIGENDFSELKNLRYLEISQNENDDGMEIASNAFRFLNRLETLILRFVNFGETLTNTFLNGLCNLTTLDLSDNWIRTIESDAFAHTPKLNRLVFCYNVCESDWNAVLSLKHLETLEFSEAEDIKWTCFLCYVFRDSNIRIYYV